MEKVSENVGTARIDTRNGGSMNLKFWDKKARLVAAFSDLTVDEAREVVRKARPGWTLSIIGKRARKGALDDYASAMIAEAEKEVESNAE